jgi:hypothetical protein
MVSAFNQAFAQFLVIIYDAIVYNGYLPGTVRMGMSVGLSNSAMRCPACVAYAYLPRYFIQLILPVDVIQFADAFADYQFAGGYHGDTG